MKWSEVIRVRSAGSSAKNLEKTVQNLMADLAGNSGNDDIRIFIRENLETDICVVLFHSGKKTHTGGSPLGLRIAAAFKEVGLVNSTIWNEME